MIKINELYVNTRLCCHLNEQKTGHIHLAFVRLPVAGGDSENISGAL